MNHLRHEIVTATANGKSHIIAYHSLNSRDRPEAFFSDGVVRGETAGSLRAVPVDKPLRRVNVDDPSVLDDCYPVAQPFGLFHQMSGQKHCLAALTDASHQIPDCPPRLRVQPGGQFVEKHHLRIVNQCKGNKEPLLLASREVHEPGAPLIGEAELFE